MSRIRSVKPELAKDEELAELPIAARYLFALLPTQADREGRMDDRPRVLKLEIFPWDDVDVESLLAHLAPKFIIRYEINGRRYIQIRNFLKHQRPNNKELPSTIPAATEDQLNARFAQKKRSLIQKKATLIQNEGIGVGKGRGREGERVGVVPEAREAEIVQPLTPIQKVVRGFKEAKGVDANEKDWDRKFFSRFARPAKELLEVFNGDAKRAIDYILAKGEEWKHLPDWGIEAVVKAAGREYNRIGGLDGPKDGALESDRMVRSRRPGFTASSRTLAGDALRQLTDTRVSSERTTDVGGPEPDSFDNEAFEP